VVEEVSRRSGSERRTVVTAVLLVDYCPAQRVDGKDGQA
jgi:hypothetical protein